MNKDKLFIVIKISLILSLFVKCPFWCVHAEEQENETEEPTANEIENDSAEKNEVEEDVITIDIDKNNKETDFSDNNPHPAENESEETTRLETEEIFEGSFSESIQKENALIESDTNGIDEPFAAGWDSKQEKYAVYDSDNNLVWLRDILADIEDPNSGAIHTYYFGSDSKYIKNAEQEYENNYYYFDGFGHAIKNEWDSAQQKYYLANGQRAYKTIRIHNYYYYFDELTGIKKTDCFVTINSGYTVYYDENGHLVFGTKKIDDNWYNFSQVNGNMIINQFVDINENYRVYYDDKGHLVFGTKKIGNYWYNFNPVNGNMIKNSFVKIQEGYTVYYNANGHLVFGDQIIGNYWYRFNTTNGNMVVGFQTKNGNKVCFDNQGRQLFGRAQYNGEWYYFDPSSGKMITGWVWFNDLGYSVHYDTSSGILARGTVMINNVKHSFASNGKGQPLTEWVNKNIAGKKYYIKVNRKANTTTVYTKDYLGKYTIPVKAMICSTGKETPLGKYNTFNRSRWRALYGGVYGQYATDIVGDILFHSVPYAATRVNTLYYWKYNQLGTTASMGCVRLTVADAKWIYDNCAIGTTVEFYDNTKNPGPLGKPSAKKLSNNSKGYWDPTDPAPGNPWRN